MYIRRGEMHNASIEESNITAWLQELASRWEYQPDGNEIHMAFPSKQVRYRVRCEGCAVDLLRNKLHQL